MSNYPPPGHQNPYNAPGQQLPPDQGGGGCFSCFGCAAITLVVLLLACGIGGWWVYYVVPGMVADAAAGAIKESIDKSEMTDAEKAGVKGQIDRLVTNFKEGKITVEKFGKFAQDLEKSPIFPAITILGANKFIADSEDLEDAEKAEGVLTIRRIMTGAFEQKIPKEKLDALKAKITTRVGNKEELKEEISDEDLRAFLAEAKQAADDAGIPTDPSLQIDPAKAFEQLVDKLLAEPK
jgi:hypothetical protein